MADDDRVGTQISGTGGAAQALIVANDACYRARGYRSFEFASFSAFPGEVVVLFGADRAQARDLALACAGLVRPTEGSLVVAGADIARGSRPPRGAAGAGVFCGLLDVDGVLTVEEVVRREAGLRRGPASDTLDYLAEFGLATHAEQGVDALGPAARARLSGALACSGGVRVAALDLNDPFCDGLSADDAAAAVSCLRRFAQSHAACVVVAAREVAAARAADFAVALDMASADALARRGAHTRKEVGAA